MIPPESSVANLRPARLPALAAAPALFGLLALAETTAVRALGIRTGAGWLPFVANTVLAYAAAGLAVGLALALLARLLLRGRGRPGEPAAALGAGAFAAALLLYGADAVSRASSARWVEWPKLGGLLGVALASAALFVAVRSRLRKASLDLASWTVRLFVAWSLAFLAFLWGEEMGWGSTFGLSGPGAPVALLVAAMAGAVALSRAETASWLVRGTCGATAALWILGSDLPSRIAAARPDPSPGSPNVLWIVVDTLRKDRLGCYGYRRDTSPRVDALAREGVLFVDATTPVPSTRPAMASLLTGTWPAGHGVRPPHERFAGRNLSAGERFRSLGYRTGAVIANGKLSEEFGFGQGMDDHDVLGRTRANYELLPLARQFLPRWRGDDARSTTDAALRWIGGNRDAPFFLWVHYLDPHWPYDPPAQARGRFSRPEAGKGFKAMVEAHRKGRISIGEIFFDHPLEAGDLAYASDLYDEEVAFADAEIGRLLDGLRAAGLEDRTLVVFTSDHGEALGEHGLRFTHTFTLYEELIAVPLVFRWPGRLPAGRRIEEPARLVDVLPTTLALLGVRAAGVDGADLFAKGAHGNGAASADRFESYGEATTMSPEFPEYRRIHLEGTAGMWRMLRRPPWKLIVIPRIPSSEVELYDLRADPSETRNLASERPEVVADLAARLARHLAPQSGGEAERIADPEVLRTLRTLGYVR